ncbi:MAG: hypothetical protein EPO00_08110 [Chloroflexota bacterium]|nr:MAG: hypothetical protein EPO00_08110 [Chloroflexota bacterium]
MPGSRTADCRRHEDALLGLVDPATPTTGSTAALDHIEWCRACADDLQDLALAIVAMRRFGDDPPAAARSSAAWPSLSARIVQGRAAAAAAAWRWRASLAGLMAGMAVVAALVGPMALHVPLAGGVDEPTGLSPARLEGDARRVEASYIWQSSTGSLFGASAPATASGYAAPPRYPDGLVPQRKEVPVRTTGRAPRAD